MTLDPVHYDGIAELATRLSVSLPDDDGTEFANRVFKEWLNPLENDDGEPIIEPIGDTKKYEVDMEDIALSAPPFPTQHGLDAGTINPTTFRNGIVLDIAQATMAANPTDLELHRPRTVVGMAHSNDGTVDCEEDDWETFDKRHSRARLLQAPRNVSQNVEAVVHTLSLYLAEVTHARAHLDHVDDLLILDGPLYPTGLLSWEQRHPELRDLLAEAERPQDVIEQYLSLVAECVDQDIPLAGIVKNQSGRSITRALKRQHDTNIPWVDDVGLFERILSRPTPSHERRDRSVLRYTNWFISRCGVNGRFGAVAGNETIGGGATSDSLEATDTPTSPTDFEVTFCMVYDPRTRVLYRIEAPRAFTEDGTRRKMLTDQFLRDIAYEQGPPEAVAKADELARIGRDEKDELVELIERTFETTERQSYNDIRW